MTVSAMRSTLFKKKAYEREIKKVTKEKNTDV